MIAKTTGISRVIVVMGVSASGKSSVGEALAKRLGWPFEEGDDLHPASNVAKMKAGHALDDADRAPWLDAVGGWIAHQLHAANNGVISCSALKRKYRDRLRRAGDGVIFVLIDPPEPVLHARIAKRKHHFMPPGLLDSQLATLERPGAEEHALIVGGNESVDANVDHVVAWLDSHGQRQWQDAAARKERD